MWKDVAILPKGENVTSEEMLEYQVALNRRLAHLLKHIRSNQITGLEANKITTKEAFIQAAQIESLKVGDNVIMGENAFIAWDNVTDKPPLGYTYTDEDALAAIQGTYIDGNSVWTISVYAQNISTIFAKISTAQIENLIVGNNVTMGPNAYIAWSNVIGAPVIPPEYTDADVIAKIESTYIDGTNVWTVNVYAQNIKAGFLELVDGMKIGTLDQSVEIDKDGIRIDGGKILIKNGSNETLIDEFGINPKFLDYSKNLIWNSSFEVHDSNNKPLFWYLDGNGESNPNSSFYSDKSLRLAPNTTARQTWAARIKPWWIDNKTVRVSMYINRAQPISVRVVDIGTWQASGGAVVQYFTLKYKNLAPDTTVLLLGTNGWEDSRESFIIDFAASGFPSAPAPGNDTTAFALEIKNIGGDDVYIDGVMAHVDFTKSWAQLYKDGPKSIAAEQIGGSWTNPDPLASEESVFLDGVPLTDLKLYDDGMVLTFLDGTITDYDFDLDIQGNIIKLTNNTTGIETVIDDIGGAKP